MINIVLLIAVLFIYLEMKIFKSLNEPDYERIFHLHRRTILLFILMALCFYSFAPQDLHVLPGVMLLAVIPEYLIRRNRFFKSLSTGMPSLAALKSDACGIVLIWLLSLILISLTIEGLMEIFPGIASDLAAMTVSAVGSSAVVLYFIYRATRKHSASDFLTRIGLRVGANSKWKVIVVPIVLGLAMAFFSAYLLSARQNQPVTPLNEAIHATESSYVMAAFLFVALFLAPLFEEMIFRGYFFEVIRVVKTRNIAIVTIALIFAVLHFGQYWGDWVAIGMITLLGFVLTFLRSWTNSTIASVVMHYVYNISVTIMAGVMIYFANPDYFHYQMYFPDLDFPAKEAFLKKSIAKQPQLADAYNELAWLYAEQNTNLSEALSLIGKALELDGHNVAYLDTKAEILEKLGRREEALVIRQELLGQDLSDDLKMHEEKSLNFLRKTLSR